MNTAMAMRKMLEAPKRSAIQPEIGMKMASDTKYEVSANLSAIGLVPMSAAMAGRDVAITVESMFSMNRATARISGVMRINCGTGRRGTGASAFCYDPNGLLRQAEMWQSHFRDQRAAVDRGPASVENCNAA